MPTDPREERVRELERRLYRLAQLEQRMAVVEIKGKLLRRYSPDEGFPGSLRIRPLNRCGFAMTIDPTWEIRVEDPLDPLVEYTDYTWEQRPDSNAFTPDGGVVLRFSSLAGRRIIRVLLSRAGWETIELVEELRPLEDRLRSEYTYSGTASLTVKVEGLCNKGTNQAPSFDPKPGVTVSMETSRPFPHGIFLRVFGSPSGGFLRLAWGDDGTFVDIPHDADAPTIRALLEGPLEWEGNTYNVVTTVAPVNLGTGRLREDGLVVGDFPRPVLPEDGVCIYFHTDLAGIDFTGVLAKASPFWDFTTGDFPVDLDIRNADWYPRNPFGTGTPAGTALDSGVTDGAGLVSLDNNSPDTFPVDLVFDQPECTSRHRISNPQPFCPRTPLTARFCFGTKTISTSSALGPAAPLFYFGWGRHTNGFSPLAGPTWTYRVAETNLNHASIISSTCGMIGNATFPTSYPEFAQPAANPVGTGGEFDWFITCVPAQTWCCEDKSVAFQTMHLDGDADWAGRIPIVTFESICSTSYTDTGTTRRVSSGGQCKCDDTDPSGGIFLPKRVNMTIHHNFFVTDETYSDFGGGPVFGPVQTVSVDFGGVAPLVALAGNVNVYSSPEVVPTSPELERKYFRNGGDGRIVYEYLKYKYGKARVEFNFTDGFKVVVSAEVIESTTDFNYPSTPVVTQPPGKVIFCVFSFCAVPPGSYFVHLPEFIGDYCDYHIDAHCEIPADPYALPPHPASSYSATGP